MRCCKSCGEVFSYKLVFTQLMKGYRPVVCPNCGHVNEMTFGTRIRCALFTVLPMPLVIFIVRLNDVKSLVLLIIFLLALSTATLLGTPLFVTYKDKKEAAN